MDPLVEAGQENTTPYGYVLGNPIRLVDPDGKAPEDGPGPHWWRTLVASVRHIPTALATGTANGSNNISSSAVRFSTRGETEQSKKSILSEPDGDENEGSEVNAFRHTIWQATVTSQYGENAAKDIGFAHEDNPNTNWSVDYTKASFGTLHKADERIDLFNNIIGRDIGNENKGMGMKELALKALDVFKKDGLWTASKNKDGSWSISRTKITKEQYNALKKTIQSLDEKGYRRSEKALLEKAEALERGHVIK